MDLNQCLRTELARVDAVVDAVASDIAVPRGRFVRFMTRFLGLLV